MRVYFSRAGRPAKRLSCIIYGKAEECYMKGNRGYMDLGTIFDEIFEAARDFHDDFRKNFKGYPGAEGCRSEGKRSDIHSWIFDENTDYYPNYSYPPMNVFIIGDRSLIFEFALAGFDEKDISLSFQGDYMVFSAAMPGSGAGDGESDGTTEASPDDNIRYFKRRLKLKAIEKQKYFVPLDKYAQEKVKAVFRNGILRVSIPPKDEPGQNDGIKIEIITDES
jgi:HSP20 family molecular chaperone IbpA